MLKLSKKTDYALMAMTHLAVNADRPSVSVREIAEQYQIPLELLAKVMQRLVQHGLLASHHGIRGGYHLARPAMAISVANVIEAIDGPLMLTACVDGDERCDQYAHCNVRDPLGRVKDRVVEALAACTVAEIAGLGTNDDESLTVKASPAPLYGLPSRGGVPRSDRS
jgi:Rrf2 family protein